jgi:hypothetical protein
MLCNWCDSKQLCKEFGVMCENGNTWGNIEITDQDSSIDYYVIINRPPLGSYYIPSKTIVFQMEPWVYDQTKKWGVKGWGEWADPKGFMEVRGRNQNVHNNAFWQLELTLPEIINGSFSDKEPGLSTIVSKKYFDEGHIKRIDFLNFLETKGDIPLDIYGNDNFKNYKGPLTPYINKSRGYRYRYYFMIENCFERNFITEKIWEPILCESLCFYYGCPNVTDYINPLAFVQLSGNFEEDYILIKKSIEMDLWSERLIYIKQEKQKILNELAFFPVLSKIIKNKM